MFDLAEFLRWMPFLMQPNKDLCLLRDPLGTRSVGEYVNTELDLDLKHSLGEHPLVYQ